MALSGKLEAALEVKSSPEEFYRVWRKEPHQFSKHASSYIKNVIPHEHDWDSHGHGSIKIWIYTIEGREEVFKEKVEFDDENKTVTLVGLEGHIMELYNVIKGTWQVSPKGNGSLVKHILEYEAKNENIPPPYVYLTRVINMTKDLAKGLTSKA